MRSLVRLVLCLVALTISGGAPARPAGVELASAGIPSGFDNLADARLAFVDIYYGARKVGEATVTVRPGTLQFRSSAEVLAQLPELLPSPEISSALAGELPTNSDAACAQSNAGNCGILSPQVIGIIYDEDHFRVDIFVNPKFLRTIPVTRQSYLPVPGGPVSLTSSIGISASGSIGGSSVYNLQNQSVIGFQNARIRMNSSFASGTGFVVDDLVGELDRKDLRYSAGLFWAPGNDFTGQRRILGAGVGTQFDTWADQQALHGTPLVLFLAQASRVELLVDGRLVSSQSYPAGNVEVDTSALPEGSYSVVLRIHEANGSVHDEQRFFVKNAQAPPLGHPIFYAYAGVLANTRAGQAISPSGTLYYQAGGAWRLTSRFALDLSAIGTQDKAIGQGGAWFILRQARFRVAALASTAGDKGALFQASSGGQGPLSVSFDIRRIWSTNGRPLLPLSSYVDSFDEDPATGVQLATGSYTQATGSIGLRLGSGYINLVGSYRKDRNLRSDYTIGPNLNWPVVTGRQFQLVFEASAQRTRSTTAGFAGFRMSFTHGRASITAALGQSVQDDQNDARSSASRIVGDITAQYSHEGQDGTLLDLTAAADRNVDTSTVGAGATLYSRYGNLRADVLRSLEGNGTQYDLSFETGFVVTSHAASLAGRDLAQSALVIAVDGDASSQIFNVLVDEAARGRVKVGERLTLFLPSYRRYRIRLVPVAASAVDYDTASRDVTLYPGNVRRLAWTAETFFTMFAQAIAPDGSPVADGLVQTAKGVSQTDASGYFQVDVRHGDAIRIETQNGRACEVAVPRAVVKDDFASVGKVVCS